MKINKIPNLIGSFIAIITIGIVISYITEYSSEIDLLSFKATDILLLSLYSFIYFIISLLLAVAWHSVLSSFGIKIPILWSIKAFGISQFAKYLPGNVLHFAGRYIIASRKKINRPLIAKSIFIEIVMLVIAASCFFPLAIAAFLGKPFSITIFFSLILISYFSLTLYKDRNLAKILFFYLVFLFSLGFIFWLTIKVFDPSIEYSLLLSVVGSFVISWLAGFLTPGAPAGVGIREVVILYLLEGSIDQSTLLVAIVSNRLISVVGDLLFYLSSISLNSNVEENKKIL